jgi:hypothetical protein
VVEPQGGHDARQAELWAVHPSLLAAGMAQAGAVRAGATAALPAFCSCCRAPTWYTASMAMRRASGCWDQVPFSCSSAPEASQVRVMVVATPTPIWSKADSRST